MQRLDQLLTQSYETAGAQDIINKFYLTLLSSELFVPVQKIDTQQPHQAVQHIAESYMPLYTYHEDKHCILAFTSHERLQNWAKDLINQMDYAVVNGEEFVDALGTEVHVHFNIGTEFYKEFVADEIQSLKKLSGRLKLLRSGQAHL